MSRCVLSGYVFMYCVSLGYHENHYIGPTASKYIEKPITKCLNANMHQYNCSVTLFLLSSNTSDKPAPEIWYGSKHSWAWVKCRGQGGGGRSGQF